MSTNYRGNRILNAQGRRLGPQLPLAQQNDRAQRTLNRSDFDDDGLGCMRGVVFALLPSLALWAASLALAAWIFDRVVSLLAGG